MRCFFLQTCLSFISYYADVAEFVLRVQPTGMPRSNAPFQHPMQPQDDTCPRKAYRHRDTTTACLQPRQNRGRARPFWPTHPLIAVCRSSRRDGRCAWRGGGRRITIRVTCAHARAASFPVQRRWLHLTMRKRAGMQASAGGDGGRGSGECTCRASLVR